MRSKPARWLLYSALVALYLLHNDFWLWRSERVILGLPVGLLYHIVYAVTVSAFMALIVRFAWPYSRGRERSSGP